MSPPTPPSSTPSVSWLGRWLFPSWSQRKRLLRMEAWIVVVTCWILLLFAWLWPEDFRQNAVAFVLGATVAFMVRTFTFHLGLLLLLIVIVCACTRYRRLLAAAVLPALFALGPAIWEFRPRADREVIGETVTVMSVNLLAINTNTTPIIAEIRQAGPDVILFQEYTEPWHQALIGAVGEDYPHVRYVCRDDSFGAAVYSRRPFVGQVDMELPLDGGLEPQIRAVIPVAGRETAFYNIHLLPPRSLEYIMSARRQFADLLDILDRETLPAVLVGDLNATQHSAYGYALGQRGFTSAHELGGWGRGATWPVHSIFRWLPGLRLDHVYLSETLTCKHCTTGMGQGSDHRPVIAKIGFAK